MVINQKNHKITTDKGRHLKKRCPHTFFEEREKVPAPFPSPRKKQNKKKRPPVRPSVHGARHPPLRACGAGRRACGAGGEVRFQHLSPSQLISCAIWGSRYSLPAPYLPQQCFFVFILFWRLSLALTLFNSFIYLKNLECTELNVCYVFLFS